MLRDSLSLAGYYPTGMRVSEDTAMNRRFDRLAACHWAPDVHTTHKEPSSLPGLFRDNFGRGVRMAAEQPFRGKPGSPASKAQSWAALCWRNGLVRRPLADEESFNLAMAGSRLAVSFTITLAKFLGVLRGVARQRKADRLLLRAERTLAENAGPASRTLALSLGQKAVELDPQDSAKFLFLGKTLVRLGRDGSDAFRTALALDPTQPEPLAQLLAPPIARGDWTTALAMAEAAAEAAPQVAELWMMAAEIAAKAGRKALAAAYIQCALGLAPNTAAAHSKADRLYQAMGNLDAAAHRRAMADRLQAYLSTHKVMGD